MEYDDSPFESQNPQLSSEELSKSSPVLSTYSLPKYDFDDSLQGDIRFDSLVETETFLGIESQEDTSWIDDFSRGSSRIEFSSRNAEPASISRRNNVWSEATSLESVEMLLKSVGQEDILHEKTEVQDRNAFQELGSSAIQLKQNEEDRHHLSVKDVSSGAGLLVEELIQNIPGDNSVKLHPTENVQFVSGKLCGFGNIVNPLLQETDAETIGCSVTKDTQEMNKADNPSSDKKHELNQLKASLERELHEDVRTPVLQTESQVNCPQTNIEFAENLSSESHHGNQTGNLLNQNLQVNGTRDFSEGPLDVNVEGVDDMVLEKECKSERQTAESSAGGLENVVSTELDMISGGEPGAMGTGNNHLKEPHDPSTEELHDIQSMEACLGQVDTLSSAKDCKCESDEHINANASEGSNVTLEGESVSAGHSAEATNLNSGCCCDENVRSDALVIGSDGVLNNNDICASAEQNENPEESFARDDEIGSGDVMEDELGGSEQMENALALTELEKSLTENDEVLKIPSDEMSRKPTDDGSSLSVVSSSAVLPIATRDSEDLRIHITPPFSEEYIAKEINISTSTTVVRDTKETTDSADMSDGNDKCMNIIISVQSNSEVSSVDDNNCNTVGMLINDINVAARDANKKDYEEPEVSPMAVNCGSGNKDDTETKNFIQSQFDKSGTSCTDDGSVIRDPKASDASDNDKTFSFIITSSAEQSERETAKLWQPFMSQVPATSQNVDDSLSTPGMEQITLGNKGSHQTANEQIVTESRSASEHKPRRGLAKPTKESAKKGSRQKRKTPSKLTESHIFPTVESCLPDLNHASFMPTVHLQHFTDLQQLQLRAQIFVYGSLIQGTPPDEACMVAAFGGPDGGRTIWENARHRCLERIQSPKSQNSNPETLFQRQSSARTADQKSKTSKSQNKNNPPTLGEASKISPISHLTPPASPLWTVHTPDRGHFGGMPSGTFLEHNVQPQFYSHSSSPMTSSVVHASSWSPHPVPWVTSPQTSAPKASARLMMRTKMEPVILTPVRESSMSEIGVRHSSPGPVAHPAGLNNAILGVPSPIVDNRTSILNPGQTPSDTKPRQRKNIDRSEASVVTQPQHKFEMVLATSVSSILPTATVVTPNSESKEKTDASSLATRAASSAHQSTKWNIKVYDRFMISDDMRNKMDEAKLHAEDAASYSVAAVDLSKEMWSLLAKEKDNDVAPDLEAKIASAALTIAAAVAVAKAAAATAKVASDAAIEAKLMAEEAMDSCKISLVDSSTEISLDGSVSGLGNDMSSFISKGENEMISGGSLAARSTAREKIESGAASSRRAENLNAIVKAAELAAEAVTQAGKVAVMGNPLPLSELANAGPEGCWKLTFDRQPQSNTVMDCHKVDANKGGANTTMSYRETIHVSKETADDHSLDTIPHDGCELTSVDLGNKVKKPLGTAEVKAIKEGSYVEIYKEGNAVKAAWFSAKVLELKKGEAYVRYMDKSPTESSGDFTEWITLDSQQNEAPKVRAAHPLSALPTEGTRKRRREAMGKCSWSVGDRVDAWRQNCWWEGIITEKGSKDDTAFTVHFSAQGETSIIKVCHLRPSLFWHDGEWVEWSSSMSTDGDTRQEKRMKLCDPAEHKVERNEKASEKVDPESKIHGEPRLLGLSDNEKTFDVGKSSKDGKRPADHRMARLGLQNEGNKVSFGVPRPGKKRKFMDVSQHYVSCDVKTNESNDSTRRSKILMPKGSGLPGWKSGTRIDLREKQVPATKLTLANSRKATGVPDRTFDKNNVSSTVSSKENAFRSQGMTGFASFSSTGRARNAPFEFSASSNEKFSKKLASTSSKPGLSSKTNFEPPSQKLGKIEENKVYISAAGTANSEGVEPRRSNRRIQPTSRLLEGLQTSLSTPKLSSVSHNKGVKSHNRSASSLGNQ
ncbi:unnamed protein product [Rhodiola kirilowii]